MQYENLRQKPASDAQGSTVLSVCPAGVMESTITVPSRIGSQAPLLALHGISRNAEELSRAFAPVAEATGRIVVVPHFSADKWPVYQRVTRRARPDKALLALLCTLRSMDEAFQVPPDIFGFSGGAQLAHRFAMLYPEAVGNIHLGAAGWYTLPDESAEYPYGIGDTNGRRESWGRLMRSGLQRFLRRRIDVYVGGDDTERDESLRKNAKLDAQQGHDRVERALNYVAAVNNRQSSLGLPCTGHLTILPGCDHRFRTCSQLGDLAWRVCAAR